MRNWKKETLDKKEIELRNLKIKFNENIVINKLEDVFDNLFNKEKATYYLDNKLHCGSAKGRSYIDCFHLCCYYFPNITYYEMYHRLRKLVGEQNPTFNFSYNGKPCFFLCNTIGRSRFYGKLIV